MISTTMLAGMPLANLSPIANHLWQSTLCAAAIWLLTLALKKNRAAVRYWLWLAASVKFLIPFSLLVSLGSRFPFGWHTASATIVAQPQWTYMAENIGRPFSIAPPVTQAVASLTANPLPAILLGVWLCGFAVSVAFWFRTWRQMRAARQAATPLALGLPIPVMSSSTLMEPGVFGIRKPVLLLPAGIAERLTPEQLNAVLAHEMCHVRRRDNLTAAIHMLVEAVFWFYPLVWWLRARLVEERERACDEAVLQSGSDAEAYAEGILNVCKFYVESPLACVSGISGSDLKCRIIRIMTWRAASQLSFSRKLLLATALIAIVIGPVVFGITMPSPTAAQWVAATQDSTPPPFEVASIRPDHSGESFDTRLDPGRFVMERWRVRDMVVYAYDLKEPQLFGGAKWIEDERYDVEAKLDESDAAKEQNLPMEERIARMRLRVQDLLGSRFGLRVHHSVKDLPVLALVVAKNGPKFSATSALSPVAEVSGSNVRMSMDRMQWVLNLENAPLQYLVLALSGQPEIAGRILVDKTDLTGNFSLKLQWEPQNLTATASAGSDPAGATLFTALQEQLGLRLESRKAPVDVVVIDHVERPSPN